MLRVEDMRRLWRERLSRRVAARRGFSAILEREALEGTRLEVPVYHVLLGGRKVGPYDRRTIVGMRIKQTLTSEHVLIATDGTQLSVADLVQLRAPDGNFQPNRSGTYSLVQATYPASLTGVQGPGPQVPAFKGEIEARVQSGVLRLAGRFRKGMGWKEDRVKLPLKNVVHARVRGSMVDLWLRHAGKEGFQRITLELFTPESAGELVDWLPDATPWPQADSLPAPLSVPKPGYPMLWVAVIGTMVVIGAVFVLVLTRRIY
jgi:hypothetical protein